jgi:hypothetical protein
MKFGPFGGRSQQERMDAMVERLGVDVVSLAESHLGRDLAAATAECRKCNKVGTCESWLDGKAPAAQPYTFCPNSALFDEHLRK